MWLPAWTTWMRTIGASALLRLKVQAPFVAEFARVLAIAGDLQSLATSASLKRSWNHARERV